MTALEPVDVVPATDPVDGADRHLDGRAGRGSDAGAERAFDASAEYPAVHHHHPPVERAHLPVAIDVDGVSKVFGREGRAPTTALDDVSFEIRVGEFCTLIGPSGCGKSTLLRLVSGLAQPSDGKITVHGLTPLEARRKRQFGIVFQSPVLFDWRTVEQNIALPLQIFGEERDKIRERVAELMGLVGLAEFGTHYPWQLSGGMQQRVAIARALTFAPPFLLMDEPFGALDLITRDRMAQELLRIWSSTPGTTVLFITHSISEAILLSDRVVVLSPRPGRVQRIVDVDLPRPRTEAVRESQAFFRYDTELRRLLLEAEGPVA
jgi:NitT/TauT family transport system ATP-binding protein